MVLEGIGRDFAQEASVSNSSRSPMKEKKKELVSYSEMLL